MPRLKRKGSGQARLATLKFINSPKLSVWENPNSQKASENENLNKFAAEVIPVDKALKWIKSPQFEVPVRGDSGITTPKMASKRGRLLTKKKNPYLHQSDDEEVTAKPARTRAMHTDLSMLCDNQPRATKRSTAAPRRKKNAGILFDDSAIESDDPATGVTKDKLRKAPKPICLPNQRPTVSVSLSKGVIDKGVSEMSVNTRLRQLRT